MAKKLTRKTLDQLAESMIILCKEEQMDFIGGKMVIATQNGELSTTFDSNIIGSIISDYKTMEDDKEKVYWCVLDNNGGYKVHSSVGTINSSESYANGLSIQGSAVNKDTFKFLSQNTDVEWGMFEDNQQDESEEKVASQLFTSGRSHDIVPPGRKPGQSTYGGFDTMYHSHPTSGDASPSDLENANIFDDRGIKDQYIYDVQNDQYKLYH